MCAIRDAISRAFGKRSGCYVAGLALKCTRTRKSIRSFAIHLANFELTLIRRTGCQSQQSLAMLCIIFPPPIVCHITVEVPDSMTAPSAPLVFGGYSVW